MFGLTALPYEGVSAAFAVTLTDISIAMDAPQDTINALNGKIGRLEGISAKAVYSK